MCPIFLCLARPLSVTIETLKSLIKLASRGKPWSTSSAPTAKQLAPEVIADRVARCRFRDGVFSSRRPVSELFMRQ